MRVFDDIRSAWKWLGLPGQIFVVALVASWTYGYLVGPSIVRSILSFTATFAGLLFGFRLIRSFIRQSIWRLRNRLMVTYAFIGLVPILLIGTLALVAVWTLCGQTAVYLVTSEFNRRLDVLHRGLQSILRDPPSSRAAALQKQGAFLRETYPELEIVLDEGDSGRFPVTSDLKPSKRKPGGRGVLSMNGEYFGWVDISENQTRAMAVFPLTREFMIDLVPGLGDISLVNFTDRKTKVRGSRNSGTLGLTKSGLPAKQNSMDFEVLWFVSVGVMDYDRGEIEKGTAFAVQSRISAVWGTLTREVELESANALTVILFSAIAFMLVEIVALIVGISFSRSITSSVHNLYEGTERVMEGDFSHRIRVYGADQLAALGHSFNRMTENLEQLLKVSKEKERYEAELEIAREIQRQLYPKSVPESASLKLVALYKPARMVSGDYYDYRRLNDTQIAIAIGDVAGKGISAALLMATIQSSFRSQLQQLAAKGEKNISTARIVSLLNEHLYANTPPEKFATFFAAFFDEPTSTLHYTNAGHLQPILIRDGRAQVLEVDGMVIGAFPFARYGESQIQLQPGDLIVCFTDGISEPENEYGEMYGEERLTELVIRNASRPDDQIVKTIIESVEKWTGSPELQDDMTLLLIRRK